MGWIGVWRFDMRVPVYPRFASDCIVGQVADQTIDLLRLHLKERTC